MPYHVVIADPIIRRPPGACAVTECGRKAGYAFGAVYLCAEHLINACESELVRNIDTIYRVAEYVEGT